MPRAPLALLMATAAALLSTVSAPQPTTEPNALTQLNPWVSACDLVHNASEDLQGVCMAQFRLPLPKHPSTSTSSSPLRETCPPPCTDTDTDTDADGTNTTNQCLLYLEEAHGVAVCDTGRPLEQRLRTLGALRLRHCCEHAVVEAFRPQDRRAIRTGGPPCRRRLQALLAVDALAARISCEFTEVLTRYDCAQPYSIVYHCDDCKEAYRRWVCSSLVPHLTSAGGRVRPCRAVCQAVEQRCPYLLPGDRAPAHPTQYAGEPTFLCLDPNIPETGAQRERSSHGDDECCYTYCGGPGRPPCVACRGGVPNATWGPAACGPPGQRATPPCRPIAISAAVSSNTLHVHTLTILLLVVVVAAAAAALSDSALCSLLTCCVCECARTTAPPTSYRYRWTS